MIGELTTHLWQSTFFAIAAGLLTVAFRRNRAAVRYWLWLSASFKFFVPFALLMSLGSLLETRVPAAHRIATQIAAPAVSYTMEQFGQPLFAESLPAAPPVQDPIHWIPIATLGVWLCGFVATALIRFRSWLRVRVAVRTSVATNIATEVPVRVSPGLLEPGVVGFLRPVLLLPEGITERLTSSEMKAVLTHELCHVRRRDNLFAVIHMIVETVFWFHPLIWWIGARLVEERESACDEEVLRLGNDSDVYVDAILRVCKLYMESPLACVSGVSGASIRRRVEAIMANRGASGLNRAKKLLLASAGLVALTGPVVIGLLIGVGHAPVVRAQSTAPPITHVTAPAPAAPIQLAHAQAPPIRAEPPQQEHDITGRWQGTLHADKDLRIVMKVSRADTGGLKGVMYSIDQGTRALPASITLQGTTVKFAVIAVGGTYEGKLANPDGTSITGTWSQGPNPLPLDLTLANDKTAWAIPEPPPPPKQIPADANPTFEVATIKPSKEGTPLSIYPTASGTLMATDASLAYLIKFAWQVHPGQITKGPAWLDVDKYDLTAKPDIEGQPSLKQMRVMVQKLLADRFQLTFHREKKELSAYAITVAKGGVKLARNESNPNGIPGYGVGPAGMRVINSTIEEFIGFVLNHYLELPVVDQTGLGSARYDFVLKWTPDASQSQPGAAMQEQLGLKLESTRTLVDVLVIDKVEKASDN